MRHIVAIELQIIMCRCGNNKRELPGIRRPQIVTLPSATVRNIGRPKGVTIDEVERRSREELDIKILRVLRRSSMQNRRYNVANARRPAEVFPHAVRCSDIDARAGSREGKSRLCCTNSDSNDIHPGSAACKG